MQKSLLLLVVMLIGVFVYQLRYGHGGAHDDKKVREQIENKTKTITNLENRNSLAELKIASLKGTPEFLEARARMELGLIRPHEVLVKLNKPITAPNIAPINTNSKGI